MWMCCIFLDLTKDVTQWTRNQTSVCISFGNTSDSKGLTWTCLTISKNSSIIALKCTFDYIFCNLLENSLLSSKHVENAIKLKPIEFISYLLVSKTIFDKIKLNFTFFLVKSELFIRLLRWLNSNKHFDTFVLGHY